MSSSCCEHDCRAPGYRRILWVALGVNVSMFLVEITASFVAGSVSLRADALDFLADALNYAIALAVIGLSLRWRAGAALVKGGIMALFGLWVAGSIVNNAMLRAVPEAELIGGVGLLANYLPETILVASIVILLWRFIVEDFMPQFFHVLLPVYVTLGVLVALHILITLVFPVRWAAIAR